LTDYNLNIVYVLLECCYLFGMASWKSIHYFWISRWKGKIIWLPILGLLN